MIRKARVGDVAEIQKLIMAFAEKNEMLPRSVGDLYECLRDFYVYEEDGKILGCGALHVVWEDLGEVKSVAVREECRGRGIGSKLVAKCIEEMEVLGMGRVFVLTYQPDFFRKLGFKPIKKEKLPHKVWTECIRCPQFPDCKEEALIYEKRSKA